MSFDSREREDELHERLDDALEDAEDDGITEEQLDKDRSILESAIRDYVSSRNSFLDQMLSAVLDDGSGDLRPAWMNAVSSLEPVATRTFSDRIEDLGTASEQAKLFCAQVGDDEAEFVAALEDAKDVAEARDFLVHYLARVEKETQRLEVAWEDLVTTHQDHDKAERLLVEEAERVMEQAARMAADRARALPERIADAVGLLNMALTVTTAGAKVVAPELSEALEALKNTVKQLLEEFKLLNPALRQRLDDYRKAVRTDAGVTVALLKGYRDETQRFIKEFGYEYMLDKAEAADDALDALVARCATDGQRSDASAFADAARRAIHARRDAGKTTWDNFVKRHERKFMGVLGPSEKAELLGTTDWEKELAELQHAHLLSFLQEWRDPSRTHVLVTKAEDLRLLVGPLADDLVEPLVEELATWHAQAGDLFTQIRQMTEMAAEEVTDLLDDVK